MLFAWATVERHILIFHDRWISTRKRRLILHYFPLLFFPVYLFLFYFLVYFFPPCDNYSDPSSLICALPCFYDDYALTTYDYVMQQFLPTFAIVFFSITLLLRVLWQRVRMRQTIHWKKHRKMAIQILSISCVYLLLLFPYAIVYLVEFYVDLSSPLLTELFLSTSFANYFIPLVFPFVCVLSLPELQKKIKDLLHLRQTRQVQPVIAFHTRTHPTGTTRQT